jgi:hypothetical protein
MKTGFKLGGRFIMDCYDKDGNHKWHNETRNLVVNEGLNHALNVLMHGDTPITAWYLALFNTNTTILATHTYAVPGFTETLNYDEVNRQAWVGAAASAQSITNSANRAVYTMSATETIYGAAIVGGGSDADTKDDQAGGGVLFCAAHFVNAKSVNDDDTLEVTYTLGALDDGV